MLGQTNGELTSPKAPNPFNYQFNRTSPTNGINAINSINASSPKLSSQPQQTNTANSSAGHIKPEGNLLNCSTDSTARPNNQSINNVSNNSSSSGTSSKSNKSTATPNPWTEKLKPKCNCCEMQKIECHLETKELWDKFNELGTEMIITKTGRYGSRPGAV